MQYLLQPPRFQQAMRLLLLLLLQAAIVARSCNVYATAAVLAFVLASSWRPYRSAVKYPSRLAW
jgi:hypothetical protein